MSKQLLLLTLCAFGLFATGCSTTPTPAIATDQHLERFRALAGDWDADINGDGESDALITYEVTANGSVVLERMFAGKPHEMITMYHMNGDALMMTHYCSAKNQPRMVATDIDDDSITFSFFDITNLATPNTLHIHGAAFDFKDNDHFTCNWSALENGEPSEPLEFSLERRP
jgi:hypothetical protein